MARRGRASVVAARQRCARLAAARRDAGTLVHGRHRSAAEIEARPKKAANEFSSTSEVERKFAALQSSAKLPTRGPDGAEAADALPSDSTPAPAPRDQPRNYCAACWFAGTVGAKHDVRRCFVDRERQTSQRRTDSP